MVALPMRGMMNWKAVAANRASAAQAYLFRKPAMRVQTSFGPVSVLPESSCVLMVMSAGEDLG